MEIFLPFYDVNNIDKTPLSCFLFCEEEILASANTFEAGDS